MIFKLLLLFWTAQAWPSRTFGYFGLRRRGPDALSADKLLFYCSYCTIAAIAAVAAVAPIASIAAVAAPTAIAAIATTIATIHNNCIMYNNSINASNCNNG